jgi:formylglycine-generating enzyme required for sulfatase activity
MGFPRIAGVASLMLLCGIGLVHPEKRLAHVRAANDGQHVTRLTAADEHKLKPKDKFRECENCPEMVVVPAGSFTMGAPTSEKGGYTSVFANYNDEVPQHLVTIGRQFAVGKLHITVDQFAAFVQETNWTSTKCYKWRSKNMDGSWRDPGFAQEGSHPVVCVSWDDANAYANWLVKKTGKAYRLLSESEFEFAARGRTAPGAYPRMWFGEGEDEKELCRYGNLADQSALADQNAQDGAARGRKWAVVPCNDGFTYTSPAGHYEANAFGLYDMAGNAWQWTADCYHLNYNDAPADGSAWTTDNCRNGRVVRGGSWLDLPIALRAAQRYAFRAGVYNVGPSSQDADPLSPAP